MARNEVAIQQSGWSRSTTTSPLILLAAGGTGGHLFPAEALAVN